VLVREDEGGGRIKQRLAEAVGEPLETTPLERSPDYIVVRLEGYVLVDADTTGVVPLKHSREPNERDNSLLRHDESAPGARLEGWLFTPDAQQPSKTVPLFRWRSPSRADTLSTTDHRLMIGNPLHEARPSPLVHDDYGSPALIGFVFDPQRPQPTGTVPLWRWFSQSRFDHDTSTHTNWRFSA
jgi:hypothetical protein